MADPLQRTIESAVTEATGEDFAIQNMKPCSGGCINQASIAQGNGRSYFIKSNRDAGASQMFAAEVKCLEAINAARTIRAPKAITQGQAGGAAFLVLEAIAFGGSPRDWSTMGEQLAALHRKVNDRFGWEADNYIGSSPQHNAWTDDWATFYRDQRLRPQLQWAAQRGSPITGADDLLDAIDTLLAGHAPSPSLLHGDLWGGNAGHDAQGAPVIYDPASYYGDRETDLAFTEMFGGFPRSFYEAYERVWPLPEGHEQRKELYNLYHIINHANLFGGGYHGQAESVIQRLLRSV